MSTSTRDMAQTLFAWRQQRFGSPLFVPVAMTLVVASLVGSDWPGPLQIALRLPAAWLAVLAFRLWDDLEDRERDAQSHPERVLTQVTSARPFALLVTFILLLTAPLVFAGGGSVVVFLATIAGLMVFYRTYGTGRPGSDFVVLFKYPLIVLALGASWQPMSLAAAGVVLLGVSIDEAAQRLHSSAATRAGLLAVTFGLLCSFKIVEHFHAS